VATSLLLFEPAVALVACLLGWTMLAIGVSDARQFIVPDVLSLPAIPAGLVATRLLGDSETASSAVLEHTVAAALGAAALYAIRQIYYYWRQRDGLGLGDVKLAAAAGAWTGLEGLSHVLLLACALAIGYVVLIHVRNLGAIKGSAAVPFGVFLGPAIWLVWCAAETGLETDVGALLAWP
jgi:leader peptidase (prepilin peptidase)/N-methyltransferase